MKYKIYVDGKMVAILPGNLNRDTFVDTLRIYLFNDEFNSWKKFEIKEED